MASNKAPHKKPVNQEILAKLASVYRSSNIQRDVFGRRAALPSEVARMLAQHAVEPRDPASLTGQSGGAAASTYLKAGEG